MGLHRLQSLTIASSTGITACRRVDERIRTDVDGRQEQEEIRCERYMQCHPNNYVDLIYNKSTILELHGVSG